MRQDRISDALLPSSGAAAPRLGHALLWTPSYVRDDKILWHVPFLFWLIEATRPRKYVEIGVGAGVAYMAACQAFHRMRAHAQCYAVGAWKDGDGKIEVPERLAARNADLYEDFSRILVDGIEESAEAVEDGSVDLMLVNLTQDPSIAKSLQTTWTPKLSGHGILLLNGIKTEDPGIAALVEALSGQSPTIQMPGGDGLLVVLPGRGPDEELSNIAALTPDDPAHKLIVQMFTRLGAGAYHEVHAREGADRADALDERIRTVTEERDGLVARLEERERQYDARHRKVAILQSRCFDLQIAADSARSEVERLSLELSETKAEEKKANGLLDHERAAKHDAQERLDKALAEAESLGKTVTELQQELDAAAEDRRRLSEEVADERARKEETSSLLVEAERQRDKSAAEAEALAADKYYRTVKGLVTALEESENLVSALTEELRSQRQQTEVKAREAEQQALAPAASGGLLGRIIGPKRR